MDNKVHIVKTSERFKNGRLYGGHYELRVDVVRGEHVSWFGTGKKYWKYECAVRDAKKLTAFLEQLFYV